MIVEYKWGWDADYPVVYYHSFVVMLDILTAPPMLFEMS